MTLKRRLERLEAAAPTVPAGEARSGNCETLYLQELQWYEVGESDLIHDSKAQTFYAPAGEFALSRHRVDVRAWFNG